MNIRIHPLGLLHILHNDVADLHLRLTESHLHQLDVLDLILDLEVPYFIYIYMGILGTQDLLSQHVLVLRDERLLRSIQTDQDAD